MNIRDVRSIKVTAVRGERDGQTGYVSVWPIFDRQDWVNVGWDDGTVTTAHPGDIIAPDEAAQLARHAAVEARLRELDRMSKRGLLAIVMEHARQRGASWVIGGPRLWSKDELINGVLDFEFGETALPPEASAGPVPLSDAPAPCPDGCEHPLTVHSADLGCWLCDCTHGRPAGSGTEVTR